MSCPKWEIDIALYAGDDLPADRLARTVAHLETCAECRALAEDLRTSQTILDELRSEPIEDAMVAQVRRGVLARLAAEQVRPARRYWTWALAGGLIVGTILTFPRPAAKPVKLARTPPLQAVVPRGTVSTLPPIVKAAHAAVRRHHRAAAKRTAPPAPGQPLLVQLVTEDPNIVIYWLVDPKPQGD
jgi:anti-sigma factor RsiW